MFKLQQVKKHVYTAEAHQP